MHIHMHACTCMVGAPALLHFHILNSEFVAVYLLHMYIEYRYGAYLL